MSEAWGNWRIVDFGDNEPRVSGSARHHNHDDDGRAQRFSDRNQDTIRASLRLALRCVR